MASQQNFVDFIIDQIKDQSRVRYKKMFGEYALYYDNKVVALVCDNQLFIKPTEAGKNFIEENSKLVEGNPYPGSKLWLLIEDEIENSEFINELLEITSKELPAPKLKAKKK